MVRLESLTLVNVKNTEEGSIVFRDLPSGGSITGIYGQNGSGKTSVITALQSAGGSIGSIAVTGDVRDRSNATMDGKPLNSSMAYIAPGKSVTYEFDVTVSDKATADMKLDQTPCGKMTNDVKYNY
ncbi:AAA family ATPase [Bifidobacterium adolescentis]|jgi:ABC-type Mn2+/Zn2+ transport system ATPase subunit|uniref:AAA family ATPase n=1 Tax=Bifidobacterium adolescentis TaxID=1680 RepID=UPI004063081C